MEDAELARFLERDGRLVRLGDGWAVSAAAYERARTLVVAECETAGEIALARFRDLAGCGRRDAQLLLERLDADGVTRASATGGSAPGAERAGEPRCRLALTPGRPRHRTIATRRAVAVRSRSPTAPSGAGPHGSPHARPAQDALRLPDHRVASG